MKTIGFLAKRLQLLACGMFCPVKSQFMTSRDLSCGVGRIHKFAPADLRAQVYGCERRLSRFVRRVKKVIWRNYGHIVRISRGGTAMDKNWNSKITALFQLFYYVQP